METAEANNSRTTTEKKGLLEIAGDFMRGRFSPKNVLLMGTSAGLAAILNGCVNLEYPQRLDSSNNNQKSNSQPVIPPSCNPEEFIKAHNYTAPVARGGAEEVHTVPRMIDGKIVAVPRGDYIPPEILDVANQLANCQEITEEQNELTKKFNENHPPTGMVVTSEGLVIQNKTVNPQEINTKQGLIRNETTTGWLNIDLKVLELMETDIKESGLEGSINSIIIRNSNDPIFHDAKNDKGYGDVASGNKYIGYEGRIKMDFDPEKGVNVLNIYLPNNLLHEGTAGHEVGHAPSWIKYLRHFPNELPDRFQQFDFSDPVFDSIYHQRFLQYMQAVPNGGLAPFTVDYERWIVMGKARELGKMFMPDFVADLTGPVDGMTQWYIPKDSLHEAADKLQSNLYKDAVKWLLEALDKQEKMSKIRVDKNGFLDPKLSNPPLPDWEQELAKTKIDAFTEETLGRYIMFLYYNDPEKLKTELPNEFDYIEKKILGIEALSKEEMYAEIWALRTTNRAKALELDPETVAAQERLVKLLNLENNSTTGSENKISEIHTSEETQIFDKENL